MSFHILMWIVVILLIWLSAFFSASEIAIASFNKIKIKKKADDGNEQAKKVLECSNNFNKTLSSILIGNTIVDFIMVYIITTLFADLFGNAAPILETIFIGAISLVFCEMLPKSFAKERADSFVMKTSNMLSYFITLVSPLTVGLLWTRKIFSKLHKDKVTEEDITTEDVKYIINEIEDRGEIGEKESEVIKLMLDIDKISVEKILIPRMKIIAVEKNETIENIQKILMKEKFSRIPVYDKTLDNIIGILLWKDFFKNKTLDNEFNIKKYIKTPLFVPRWFKISDMFKEFQKKHTHIAVVVDEYGGTMGLVTIEDVVEELVGEILDEYDK